MLIILFQKHRQNLDKNLFHRLIIVFEISLIVKHHPVYQLFLSLTDSPGLSYHDIPISILLSIKACEM